MSITDELRECIATAVWQYENDIKTAYIPKDKLTAIADRIDEQAEKESEAAWRRGYERGEDEAEFEDLDELRKEVQADWIPLPKDADGVPIHMGDVMEWSNGSFTVHELKLTEDGWQTWDSEHGYTVHADECIRHVQPDSWERIIEDAMDVPIGGGLIGEAIIKELVERCRRLAGE